MAFFLDQLSIDALHASVIVSKHENERWKQPGQRGDLTHQFREKHLERQGWEELNCITISDKKHGYYGVAYYKQRDDGRFDVLIAHRGTCITNFGNIAADIDILEQHPNPPILSEAVEPFIRDSLEILGRDAVIARVMHTGFSLGGFIAAAMVAKTNATHCYAITFDAPGCAYLVPEAERADKATKVVNYVLTPNGVNTCNNHLGNVYFFTHLRHRTSGSQCTDLNAALFFGAEITEEKLITFLELARTALSHNLSAVLDRYEQQGQLEVDAVYKWPTANIRITYGEQTEITNHDKFRREGTLASIPDTIWPSAIWLLTQGRRGNPTQGITGLFYRRTDIIHYTQEDSIRSQREACAFLFIMKIASTIADNVLERFDRQATETPPQAQANRLR